jgi:predicted DNA-binding transcriptional regulator AlpA
MNTRFMSELEVKQRTGISVPTLRRWRLEDKGPPFHKFGGLVRYGDEDLTSWEQTRLSGGDGVAKRPPSKTNPIRLRAIG